MKVGIGCTDDRVRAPMIEPTGLCAHSLANTSTWSTAWCARMSVAFAAATALVIMAMPTSEPLISVPIIIDAARMHRPCQHFLMRTCRGSPTFYGAHMPSTSAIPGVQFRRHCTERGSRASRKMSRKEASPWLGGCKVQYPRMCFEGV